MFNLFKKNYPNFLGVDIGTTGARAVQLGFELGKGIKLESYAYLESSDYLKILNGNNRSTDLSISDGKIVEGLRKIIKEAGMTAQKVVMSVPLSSAFSSIMSLPDMSNDEIPRAVGFEARQYVPIPLNEVIFDWNIIGKETEERDNNISIGPLRQLKKIKVFLVAIPKDVTREYMNVAKSLKLDLVALETESFSLARSLVGREEGSFIIVDIGSKATNITIVGNGNVLMSHNVSGTGGREITRIISHGLNVDFNRAEILKKDVGLKFSNPDKKVSEIILPVISIIISEIRKINDAYFRASKGRIKKIILTGGSSNLPGLADYLSKELNAVVEIGDPWKNIVYNKILSGKLKEMSPQFAVAVGLALRGFEK